MAHPHRSNAPAAANRWARLRAGRAGIIGMLALILAAYVLPRALALHGVEMTSAHRFGDMGYHLISADLIWRRGALADSLSDPYFTQFPATRETGGRLRWPEGTYQVSRPFVGIFGAYSVWTTQLTNFVFSLVLLIGVVLLGRELAGLRVGLWGGLLTALNPALVANTWYYSLDYPLIAMILVGLLLLHRTRGFSSWRWSLALGLWSGLGLFIKLTYLLYLFLPALAALLLGRRAVTDVDGVDTPVVGAGAPARDASRRPARGYLVVAGSLAGSLALALLLSWLLQGWTLAEIWHELEMHYTGDTTSGALSLPLLRPWTFRWATSMGRFMLESFPWPLLLLALPGVVLLHRRGARPLAWSLLTYLWGTLLLLTLMANKMERYLQPLYPLLCLLTAWWLLTWLPRRWRTTAMIWAAVAHGAVLWVVHAGPLTFEIKDQYAAENRYMYEIPMPGRAYLDRLRAWVHHPTRDVRALLAQAEALLSQERGRRGPLGVAIFDKPGFGVPMTVPSIFQAVYLSLGQRVRHRFLISGEETLSQPLMRDLPALLVFSAPGDDLGRALPGHCVVDSRDASMPYIEGQRRSVVTVRISLLRREEASGGAPRAVR